MIGVFLVQFGAGRGCFSFEMCCCCCFLLDWGLFCLIRGVHGCSFFYVLLLCSLLVGLGIVLFACV